MSSAIFQSTLIQPQEPAELENKLRRIKSKRHSRIKIHFSAASSMLKRSFPVASRGYHHVGYQCQVNCLVD